MIIGGKTIQEIIIQSPNGEVLAVISDSEIIEKSGVSVILNDEVERLRKALELACEDVAEAAGEPVPRPEDYILKTQEEQSC